MMLLLDLIHLFNGHAERLVYCWGDLFPRSCNLIRWWMLQQELWVMYRSLLLSVLLSRFYVGKVLKIVMNKSRYSYSCYLLLKLITLPNERVLSTLFKLLVATGHDKLLWSLIRIHLVQFLNQAVFAIFHCFWQFCLF